MSLCTLVTHGVNVSYLPFPKRTCLPRPRRNKYPRLLLPPQGFGPEAKTRGRIIETPA